MENPKLSLRDTYTVHSFGVEEKDDDTPSLKYKTLRRFESDERGAVFWQGLTGTGTWVVISKENVPDTFDKLEEAYRNAVDSPEHGTEGKFNDPEFSD